MLRKCHRSPLAVPSAVSDSDRRQRTHDHARTDVSRRCRNQKSNQRMKITKKLRAFTLASLGLVVIGSAAHAQNTFHGPSDLVLTFQKTSGVGSDQTVTVALGNVSTVFRDATPNSVFTPNSANIGSLGTTLTSTFGASWWESDTLWMGAIGFRGTNITSPSLFDTDPPQTIYFSKVRTAVGTLGQANSGSTPTVINGSGDGITSAMGQVKGRIESAGTTAIFADPTSTSFIDNQNPFTVVNVQATAYSNIADGVQGRFGAGSFGTLGSVTGVELALDLFRIQYLNDRPGQSGFGEPIRTGDYLGTITIDQAGAVSFVAVPEPSTYALLGLAAAFVGVGVYRRRKAAANL